MLLVLLLISQVAADWVEISQNHYRKDPPRRSTLQPVNQYEDKPNDNRVYSNNSAIDKQWKKATIDRVSNVGNIRRVQELSVKTPIVKLRPDKNEYTKHTNDNADVNNRRHDPEHLTLRKHFHEDEVSGQINEITHKQTMTKLANVEPVKALQAKPSSQIPFNGKQVDEDKTFPNQSSDENKIYKEHGNKGYGIASDEINQNNAHSDGEYSIRNFQRLPTTGQKPPTNNLKHKFFTTTSVPRTTRRIDTIYKEDNIEPFRKIGNFEEDIKEITAEKDFKFTNRSISSKPTFHTAKLDKIRFENTEDKISKLELPTLSNLKTSPRIGIKTKVPEKSIINENIKETKDEKEDGVDKFEELSNATKKETMSAMWKLVKIVTDTIYKNTHRSFKSKIKYLENLKATILSTIEQHFEEAWPDDMEHRSSRYARYAEERGHVEFPSSESTLMTISFLTFAVFLIKLVLQVIHAYKSKTMMVTPAVVAAVGRAAAALRSQD